MRFALGLGEAVVYPACNKMVAEWMPSRERGLANGLDLCGCGRRSRCHASADCFCDAELRLAMVVRVSAADRTGGGSGVVRHRARQAVGSTRGLVRRNSNSSRLGCRKPRPRIRCWFRGARILSSRELLAMSRQLLRLRLHGLHLLQLVLYLPELGARPRPEGQPLLRHAALHRHGDLFAARRLDQRQDDQVPRATGSAAAASPSSA